MIQQDRLKNIRFKIEHEAMLAACELQKFAQPGSAQTRHMRQTVRDLGDTTKGLRLGAQPDLVDDPGQGLDCGTLSGGLGVRSGHFFPTPRLFAPDRISANCG